MNLTKDRNKRLKIANKVEDLLLSLGFEHIKDVPEETYLEHKKFGIQVFNAPIVFKHIIIYLDFPAIGNPKKIGNILEYHKLAMARQQAVFTEEVFMKKNFLKIFESVIKSFILDRAKDEEE